MMNIMNDKLRFARSRCVIFQCVVGECMRMYCGQTHTVLAGIWSIAVEVRNWSPLRGGEVTDTFVTERQTC